MPVSVVQSASANTATDPGVVTLGAAPTVGNTLLAIMASDTTIQTGVTAGAGRSYTQRLAQVGNQGFYIYTRLVTSGDAAATSFDITGANPAALAVIELTATYDKIGTVATTINANATSRTATGLSPTTTDNLVIAIAGLHTLNTVPTGPSVDNGFTLVLTQGTTTSNAVYVATKATGSTSATGTTTFSWSGNALDQDGVQIAFTALAGGNYTGSGSRATTVSLTATGSIVGGPPSTNLLMRYKADHINGNNGDAVAAWPEISGNLLPDAVQATGGNQPTLATNVVNGHKGVTFDGTNDRLTLSGTALDVFRNRATANVFIVHKSNVVTGTKTPLAYGSGTSASQSRVFITTAATVTTGGRTLDANSLVSLTGGATSASGTIEVIAARYVWSNSDLYLLRNGTQLATNTNYQTAVSTSNTASLSGVIGANSSQAAEFYSGTILEILVYESDVTALREQVHSYIANEYGITILGLGNGSSATTVSITADGALGGVEYTGSGSRATTAAITATGSTTGSATAATSVSLTAAGTLTLSGAGTAATTVSLTASAILTLSGTAASSVTATLTAAGILTATGTSSNATSVTLTAAGVLSVTGSGDGATTVGITAAGFVSGTAVPLVEVWDKTLTAEEGTNGTTISTAITTQASAVGIGATSAATYANDQVYEGSLSYKFAPSASADTTSMTIPMTANSTEATAEIWFRISALSTTADIRMMTFRHSGNGISMYLLMLQTGRIRIQNSAGSTLDTMVPAVPLNTWYRIKPHVINGASGSVDVNIYATDGTLVETLTGTATNMGTNPISSIQVGKSNTNATGNAPITWMDSISLKRGAPVDPAANGATVGVSLTATGIISGTGSQAITSSRSASGVATSSASRASTVAITAMGSLSTIEYTGSGTAASTVALSAAGFLTLVGSGDQATSVTVTATGAPTFSGTSDLAVTVSGTATGLVNISGSSVNATTVTLTATGSIVGSGGSLPTSITGTAAGFLTLSGTGSNATTASRTATGGTAGTGTRSSTVSITAAGYLFSGGQRITTVALTATGYLGFLGSGNQGTTVSLSGDGRVAGQAARPVTVSITAAGSPTAASNRASTVALTATGNLFISETANQPVTVSGTAVGAVFGTAASPTTVSITAVGAVNYTGAASRNVMVSITATGAREHLPEPPVREGKLRVASGPDTTGITVTKMRGSSISATLID